MKIEIIRQIASHDIQHLLREPRFPIFKGFTTSYILSLCLIASAYTLQISVRLYSFLCSFQKYTISNLKLHYLNNYSPINLISSGLFLDSSIHSSRLTWSFGRVYTYFNVKYTYAAAHSTEPSSKTTRAAI